jgi:hypothetical protein
MNIKAGKKQPEAQGTARSMYRKFLYGGDATETSSLYSGVKTKAAAVEVPSTLDLISSMNSGSSTPAATSFRESLISVPKADDVEIKDAARVTPGAAVMPTMSSFGKSLDVGANSAPLGLGNFKQEIANVESNGGNYAALNAHSSATGKYQFLWGSWGKQISTVTGVKSRKEFLNSPKAQEQFMDHYTKAVILPGVKQLREKGRTQDFSDSDLGKMIHFQGIAGARKQLDSGKLASASHTNLSVREYLRRSKSAH